MPGRLPLQLIEMHPAIEIEMIVEEFADSLGAVTAGLIDV